MLRLVNLSLRWRQPSLQRSVLFHPSLPPSHSSIHLCPRFLSTSSSTSNASNDTSSVLKSPPPDREDNAVYHGPLTKTFRRLKVFSLSSLGLSFTMAPFIFGIESSLPTTARIALATTALSTSAVSTALVAWCGGPYVTDLRRLSPSENDGMEGLEMTTLTLGLHKLITRVYDVDFLVETKRPFAKWELAEQIIITPSKENSSTPSKLGVQGREETIAETLNTKGEILGRWIVKWDENGTGTCRAMGKVVRYFNVHEELLA